MELIDFYWKVKNLDVIMPYLRLPWISGFNRNHVSRAEVCTDRQRETIDRMVRDGLVWVIARKSVPQGKEARP